MLHTNSPLGRTYLGTIQIQKSFAAGFELERRLYAREHQGRDLAHQQPGLLELPVRDGGWAAVGPKPHDVGVQRAGQVTVSGTVNLPFRTSLSLIYLGRAGDPYGWTVNGDANADGINGNDLPFIPADATQITLVDPTQFTALSNFIDSQSCLKEARGAFCAATRAATHGRTT